MVSSVVKIHGAKTETKTFDRFMDAVEYLFTDSEKHPYALYRYCKDVNNSDVITFINGQIARTYAILSRHGAKLTTKAFNTITEASDYALSQSSMSRNHDIEYEMFRFTPCGMDRYIFKNGDFVRYID